LFKRVFERQRTNTNPPIRIVPPKIAGSSPVGHLMIRRRNVALGSTAGGI
jgi:hypothetical protein